MFSSSSRRKSLIVDSANFVRREWHRSCVARNAESSPAVLSDSRATSLRSSSLCRARSVLPGTTRVQGGAALPARPPLKARWMELFDIVSASVPNLMRWLRLMVPYETPALRCLYACLFLLGRNVRVSHRAAGRGSLRGRRGAGYAGWPGFKAPRRWVAFYGDITLPHG